MIEKIKFLLPEEAAEMTLAQVGRLRLIESRLRALFDGASYQEVMPPSFEYTDLYTNLGSKVSGGFSTEKMFQFIDHEGKSIALRYDFTVPLVRTYAQAKLGNVARYAYFGKVYRKEKRHKGRRTEAYQIGVELLGEAPSLAEQEILRLALDAITALKLNRVVFEIGSASFFNRLCDLVGTDNTAELTELLLKKDLSGMEKFVAKNDFSTDFCELLEKILTVTDLAELGACVAQTKDEVLAQALADLTANVQQLDTRWQVTVNLGMVPTMDYYNGLMFKAYSDAVSQPILSGGRYDELLTKFGKNAAAIGFCCQMDAILKALENQLVFSSEKEEK